VADAGRRAGQTAAPDRSHAGADPSGWVVWVQFAGMMMIMGGSFHVISGLVALLKDDYYVVGSSGLVINVDYTIWGWTHLLLGLLVFATGCGALAGKTWARVVGVVLAGISAVANMLFLAAYPVWSIVIITLDVIVIYALIVHGREAART
jgi:hypothetical protein